jgi:NAD(P)-dependent dehydrogenase (short-subunit alcohol dehydrogenase family)
MKDKVTLVTGGAGNLGQAVTRMMLERGARVAVPFYKSDAPSSIEGLKREFGPAFYSFALDLTTERGAEQAVRQVLEWGGGLHSVVHLVGGFHGGRLADTPLDAWERLIQLNMTSAYLIARFALPVLAEGGGGSFVFVSSRAAFDAPAGRAAYAATKAGLLQLARAVAEEYGGEGIRSNVIVPDTIDTEDNRRAMPDADHSRWIRPEEIAKVILFLASGEASAINGAVLPVYGSG